MRRVLGVVLGIAGTVLSAGCSATVTSPSPAVPIRVTVAPTPTLVGGPDSATFTLRAENIGSSVVDLTFPSSCQILPYFVDRITGQPVTPRGGGFACLTVITRQSLRAGESFANVAIIKAGDVPASPYIVLPPGTYAMYARLEDDTYRVRSDDVVFSVR